MRLRLGRVEHDVSTHTLVMGVLPRGPLDAVLVRAEEMVGDGADVIDVGGLQAGPGPPVGEDEELERLVPVVAAVRDRFEIAVAVETRRPGVLAAACAAGAVVGRDATGLADDALLATAAEVGATVVVTHAGPQAPAGGGRPSGFVGEVRSKLAERVAQARKAGVAEDRIIVDAGLAQGKEPAEALALLRRSADLADLGRPLLVDASSGIFLGPDGRRVAAYAAQALGIARGCRLVRTAEVRAARRVADVLEAVLAARLTQTGTTEPTELAPSAGAHGG